MVTFMPPVATKNPSIVVAGRVAGRLMTGALRVQVIRPAVRLDEVEQAGGPKGLFRWRTMRALYSILADLGEVLVFVGGAALMILAARFVL